MLDLLKKGVLIGIGLGVTTKSKIEETVKAIVKETKISEEEGKKILDDLLKQSELAKEVLEKKTAELVNKIITNLDLPSKEEVNSLKIQIEELKSKLVK